MIHVLLLIFSLALVIVAANFLVDGASSLAKRLGIDDIIIGLTVVAFGTSAPELTVNIFSAVKGSTDLAFGNIVGSNICNILLILGVSSIIRPLPFKKTSSQTDIPFSLLATILLAVVGNDILFDNSLTGNVLSRSDGLIFLTMLIIFLTYTIRSNSAVKSGDIKQRALWLTSAMIIAGLGGLFLGGKILVDNAVELARMLGLTEKVIGLTIIAIGTSLPELATSAVAVYKNKTDIAVGNVIGSNILNTLFILGVTPLIRAVPLQPSANFDILIMIGCTVLLIGASSAIGKPRISRFIGISFVVLYSIYITLSIIR